MGSEGQARQAATAKSDQAPGARSCDQTNSIFTTEPILIFISDTTYSIFNSTHPSVRSEWWRVSGQVRSGSVQRRRGERGSWGERR